MLRSPATQILNIPEMQISAWTWQLLIMLHKIML